MNGFRLNVEPSWRVQAKEARIKLMSAVGGGKDRVSAEVNYANGDVDVAEIGYQRELEEVCFLWTCFRSDISPSLRCHVFCTNAAMHM